MPAVVMHSYNASLAPSLPLEHWLERVFFINDYGDGYNQTISPDVAATRADGTGSLASYKGLNVFVVSWNRAHKAANKLAEELWEFFRARLDANNEPFYFYNPAENLIIDPTGTTETGRYYVKMRYPQQALHRTQFIQQAFSYEGIELIESREPIPA